MARRTSLYQAPRSPLIQGRTRWERPLWQPWLAGALAACAVSLWFWIWFFPSSNQMAAGSMVAFVVVPSCAAGAFVGVFLARMWGLRQRWVGALVGGVVLSAVLILALDTTLSLYWALPPK